MTKRTDDEFLKEEGLSKKKAKEIFDCYVKNAPKYHCCGDNKKSAEEIVRFLFLADTTHGGQTSCRQFCTDIGIDSDALYVIATCNVEMCESNGCTMIEECEFFKKSYYATYGNEYQS